MPEIRVIPPDGSEQLAIRLIFDPDRVLQEDVEWFARSLHEELAEGAIFLAEEKLQVGWSTLLFERHGAELVLAEPDMQSAPIRWKAGVSDSLTHLREQKDLAASFAPILTPDFALMEQTVIVCNRLAGSEGSILERLEPENERESGWFVGCSDPKHKHNRKSQLEVTSVYELATIRYRACLPYLALPPGVSIIRFPREVDVEFNGKRREIRPGSFLATLIENDAA